MATLTIDTLGLFKTLKEKGVDAKTANGIAEALREIDLDNVASQLDLDALDTKIDLKFARHENKILRWAVPILIAQAALIIAVQQYIA